MLKTNNLHIKVISIISIIIFSIISSRLYMMTNEHQTILKTSFQLKEDILKTLFSEVIEDIDIVYSNQIDLLLTKDVKNAIDNKEREKLYKIINDKYKILKNNGFKVDVIHFHTTNNISLLRFNNKEKYGDDISCFRELVKDTNKYKIKTKGLEACDCGLYYRIVKPIFLNDKHIGSVEIGISIQNIINHIKKYINYEDSLILVNKKAYEHLDKNITYEKFNDFYIIEKDKNIIYNNLKNLNLNNNLDTLQYQNKNYMISKSLELEDYKKNKLVKLLIAYDISDSVKNMNDKIIKNIFIAFLVWGFIVAIVWYAMRYLIKEIDASNKELYDTYDLFNNGEIVVVKWRNDKEFSVEYISDSISTFGYEKKDFLENKISYNDIIYKDDFEETLKSSLEHTKNKDTHYLQKYRIVDSNGNIKWVFDYTKNIFDNQNNVISHIGYLVDMTDFFIYQEKLENTLSFLNNLIQAIPTPIFVKDKDLKYNHCNEKFEKFLNIKKEDILGKGVFEIAPPDLANIYNNSDLKLIEEKHQQYESTVITQNGETKNVIFFKTILTNKNGDFNGILGVILDITERKNLETIIQREEKFLDAIFNGQENIVLVNDGERVTNANKAFLDFFNVNKLEQFLEKASCICEYFINQNKRDYLDNTKYAKIWIDIVLNNKNIEYKAVLKDKNNNDKIFRVDVKELVFYDEKKYIIMLYDITQLINYQTNLENKVKDETNNRLKQEKLLIQQSKMAAMGEMIGAIAHQWRQPLNSIALLIQSIEIAYEDEVLNEEYIEEIEKKCMQQINFMSSTIDDFRNFFKPNKDKELFAIKEALSQVISMLNVQFKSNNIHIDIDGDNFEIVGFFREFQQVIINLLNNSKDAIKEMAKDDSSYIGKINIYVDNNTKSISIKDNGGGIPDKIKDRIFEPYFTTKDTQGTGIGLYMSKMILENNMNAKIDFKNNNNGVMFTIKFNV